MIDESNNTAVAALGANEPTDEDVANLYRRLGCSRKVATQVRLGRKQVVAILKRLGLMLPSPADGRRSDKGRAAYRRELHEERRAAGLCYRCGDPVLAGQTTCERHFTIQRNHNIEARKVRASNGICCDCPSPSLPNSTRCGACLGRCRQLNKQKQAIRFEAGLCWRCGKEPCAQGKKGCEKCNAQALAKVRQIHEGRLAAGLCMKCGKAPLMATSKRFCQRCWLKERSTCHFGTISEADALQRLWDEQGGVCPYTGRVLTMGVNAHLDHRHPVSKRGEHSIDNLQWVHEDVNTLKGSFTEEDFLRLVEMIARCRLGLK